MLHRTGKQTWRSGRAAKPPDALLLWQNHAVTTKLTKCIKLITVFYFMQLILSGKCGVNSALNLKPVFNYKSVSFKTKISSTVLDDAFIFKMETEEQYLLFPFSIFCLRTRQEQNKMTLSQVLLNQNNIFSPCLEMILWMLLCGDGRCYVFFIDGLIFLQKTVKYWNILALDIIHICSRQYCLLAFSSFSCLLKWDLFSGLNESLWMQRSSYISPSTITHLSRFFLLVRCR